MISLMRKYFLTRQKNKPLFTQIKFMKLNSIRFKASILYTSILAIKMVCKDIARTADNGNFRICEHRINKYTGVL